MSKTRLQETLPVRLPRDVRDKIRIISVRTGLTSSAVMRMAINHGLPELEAGRLKLSDSATQPLAATR